MVNGALLYPNIHLKNPTAIKESLLFYDNLYRIVPEGITPKDDKEIENFNDDYNLINEIRPEKYVENTYKKFNKNLKNWSLTASGISFNIDSKLHKDKVYDKLRQKFIDEGLLDYDGTWFRGNASFIGNYMVYLAMEISKRNDLSLVTNDVPAWVSEEFMNYNGNYYSEESKLVGIYGNLEVTHRLLGLYVIDYIPSNINEITFDSIVEFRDEYKTERKNFFDKYLEFQNKVSSISSKEVYFKTIENQLDYLHDALDEYKKSCSYFKADGFFGSKIVTFPAIVDIAEGFGLIEQSLKSSLMASGLIIGGLWDLISARQRISDIRKNNPYSYLVSLEKYDFNSIKRSNSLLSCEFKEFIED